MCGQGNPQVAMQFIQRDKQMKKQTPRTPFLLAYIVWTEGVCI